MHTHLLALNAAVASEVRHLAMRSADAAKQIRTLILDSVERVERGTHLVDQAGATMSELVEAIKRVASIMTEITGASEARKDANRARQGAMLEHREPGSHDMIDVRNAA